MQHEHPFEVRRDGDTVHLIVHADEIRPGSLAERAGLPELGWIPELVILLVLLAATGMVTGLLAVPQAVLALALAAGVTWAWFARLPTVEAEVIELDAWRDAGEAPAADRRAA